MKSTWMGDATTTPPSAWEAMDRNDQVYRTVGKAQDLPVADESVHCLVTSPPYNVQIANYPSGFGDAEPWPVYMAKARKAAAEFYRVMTPGARIWLNVQATVPEVPGTPSGLRVDLLEIWKQALYKAGFAYRDLIVWVQDSFDGGCAWGSWKKPTSPNLRGSHEVILLMYKPNPDADDPAGWKIPTPYAFQRRKAGDSHVPAWEDQERLFDEDGSVLMNEKGEHATDWPELTRNVWTIRPANSGAVWVPGHNSHTEMPKENWPAAFPEELPRRAIRLSTFPGQVVLDPYAGRGTTGWAAKKLGRRCLLVDLGYGAVEPNHLHKTR